MNGEFRFGIEEEYFVNDAIKRDAARARTQEFFAQCRKNFPKGIHREMLEPQVEVAIPSCSDFADARQHLSGLRSSLGELARAHDLSVMASGTHPLAIWSRVRP